MATLATQTISRAGLASALAVAAGGGDQFTPTGRTFFYAKTAGTVSTITFATPGEAIEDVAIADLAVVMPATGERMIGPFPGGTFANSALSGRCAVTYTSVTGLTVGVFELP